MLLSIQILKGELAVEAIVKIKGRMSEISEVGQRKWGRHETDGTLLNHTAEIACPVHFLILTKYMYWVIVSNRSF